MLTTIRLVFSLVILFQTLAIGVSAQATTVVEEKPSLTMTVKSVQNVFNTGGDIPFDIVIKNTSDRPVNMLNAFEEATERSIFFRKSDFTDTGLKHRSFFAV